MGAAAGQTNTERHEHSTPPSAQRDKKSHNYEGQKNVGVFFGFFFGLVQFYNNALPERDRKVDDDRRGHDGGDSGSHGWQKRRRGHGAGHGQGT